jgi:hypothetical protein
VKRTFGQSRAATVIVAGVAGTLLSSSLAGAEGTPDVSVRRVALDVRDCPGAPEPEVRRIVGIELGDLLIAFAAPVPEDSDHLLIRCEDDLAYLEASGAGRVRQLRRALRLGDFPGDAAPRALALAGVEALASLSPEVRQRVQAGQSGQSRRREPPPLPAAPTSRTEEPSAAFVVPDRDIGCSARVLHARRPVRLGRTDRFRSRARSPVGRRARRRARGGAPKRGPGRNDRDVGLQRRLRRRPLRRPRSVRYGGARRADRVRAVGRPSDQRHERRRRTCSAALGRTGRDGMSLQRRRPSITEDRRGGRL